MLCVERYELPSVFLQVCDKLIACSKSNASLILRHHIITPGELDDLLRLLIQLCTYRIDVFPLSSGRSGSVNGQVRVDVRVFSRWRDAYTTVNQ